MFGPIRAMLDPDRSHDSGGRRPFFEGWYYKLIDEGQRHRFAVIPGVFRGADPARDHAFIQVLDGSSGQVAYNEYPITEFASAAGRFEIAIGPNRFSASELTLDVSRPDCQIAGRLRFAGVTPWPITLASPGIMGPYAWAPFMECYHGVVSLDHKIAGALSLRGETIDFTAGRGYAEKDWGRAFPSAWVWCQTNHFGAPGTSLTASVAIIPWLRSAFAGQIVGLLHDRTLYRFATYTGARIERLDVADAEIHWAIRDRQHRLELRLARSGGGLLHAPTTLNMDRRIAESLTASVDVRLIEVATSRVLFAGTGRHAGLEAAGDLSRLVDLYRAKR